MVYLVYFDSDNGSREEWSVFYAEPEVYLDKDEADKRINWLEARIPKGWSTLLVECELSKVAKTTLSERILEELAEC